MRLHIKGSYKDILVWAYWRNIELGSVAMFTHKKDYYDLINYFRTDKVSFYWDGIGIDMHKTWHHDDPIIHPLEELRLLYTDLPPQGDEGGFWVTMNSSDFSKYFRIPSTKPVEGDDL